MPTIDEVQPPIVRGRKRWINPAILASLTAWAVVPYIVGPDKFVEARQWQLALFAAVGLVGSALMGNRGRLNIWGKIWTWVLFSFFVLQTWAFGMAVTGGGK